MCTVGVRYVEACYFSCKADLISQSIAVEKCFVHEDLDYVLVPGKKRSLRKTSANSFSFLVVKKIEKGDCRINLFLLCFRNTWPF